jgi:hypothetical protein
MGGGKRGGVVEVGRGGFWLNEMKKEKGKRKRE